MQASSSSFLAHGVATFDVNLNNNHVEYKTITNYANSTLPKYSFYSYFIRGLSVLVSRKQQVLWKFPLQLSGFGSGHSCERALVSSQ